MICFNSQYQFKYFKGCILQFLLDLSLNTFISSNSLVCKFVAYIYFLLCYLCLLIDTHGHSAVDLFDMHDLVLVGRKSGSTLGQILSPHLHQQNLNQVNLHWKQSVQKIKWIRVNFPLHKKWSFLWIWSHLLNKCLMKIFISFTVYLSRNTYVNTIPVCFGGHLHN